MDDDLLIYSSIFFLVAFVLINKFYSKNLLISVGLPVGILVIYYLIRDDMNMSVLTGGGVEGLNILTDMPDF